MATIEYEFNLDPLIAFFESVGIEKVKAGVEKALYQTALAAMARSQEIVPIGGPPTSPYDVAPGTLRASGTVLMPEWKGGYCIVMLGYGGAADAYAWRQHEDLTFRHKPGQQAKYLETPVDQEIVELPSRIAEAIRGA